ncbi:MAG: hypothetical protein P8J32_08475 [bacterium]|nr:hypothetical protein [bacterium]
MKPRDYARWIDENILKDSDKKKLDGQKGQEKTEQETEEQEEKSRD